MTAAEYQEAIVVKMIRANRTDVIVERWRVQRVDRVEGNVPRSSFVATQPGPRGTGARFTAPDVVSLVPLLVCWDAVLVRLTRPVAA